MSAPLPLEGIRALTLEQVHALPWGTAFLADLGARVIRIESIAHLQDRITFQSRSRNPLQQDLDWDFADAR